MKVLILAAGYAVRLGELTKDTPKPLLSINNRRIIDRIIDKVKAVKGVDDIYVVTNNKFFGKFNDWLKDIPLKRNIYLINDGTDSNETRLGAIRDMYLGIEEKKIDDDLLVIAGDNLFDFDMKEFIAFAKKHEDCISVALHDIKEIALARNFGVLKIDKDDKVVDFEEKPEHPKSSLISTGIYYFPKNKLALIREYVKMQDKKLDAPGYYISWVSKNYAVYGFTFTEDWYDIGNIESYEKADREYSEKEKK